MSTFKVELNTVTTKAEKARAIHDLDKLIPDTEKKKNFGDRKAHELKHSLADNSSGHFGAEHLEDGWQMHWQTDTNPSELSAESEIAIALAPSDPSSDDLRRAQKRLMEVGGNVELIDQLISEKEKPTKKWYQFWD